MQTTNEIYWLTKTCHICHTQTTHVKGYTMKDHMGCNLLFLWWFRRHLGLFQGTIEKWEKENNLKSSSPCFQEYTMYLTSKQIPWGKYYHCLADEEAKLESDMCSGPYNGSTHVSKLQWPLPVMTLIQARSKGWNSWYISLKDTYKTIKLSRTVENFKWPEK